MPTDPTPPDRVREARAAVRALMTVTHPYSCAGVMRPCLAGDPATIDNARCDCGAKHLRDERLDAYAEAIRAECAAEIAALKADAERLDWLEGEEQREADANRLGTSPYPRSLFRENMPIMRESIDAARASETRGSNG